MSSSRIRGRPLGCNIFTYTHDDVGRRTASTELGGDQSAWTYDRSGQLVHEQRTGANSFSVTYTYDAANQLAIVNEGSSVTTYTHDADGNRTERETSASTFYYGWDEDSRLTSVEPPSGVVSFSYDGDGKRVQRQTPSDTTKFLFDHKRLLQETDESDTAQLEFTSTLEEYGDLLAEYGTAADSSEYHQYDAIGTTDALLDDAGAVADSYTHQAFGLENSHTGASTSHHTFIGQQNYYREPNLNVDLLDARYCDGSTGRFLSKDPLSFANGTESCRI